MAVGEEAVGQQSQKEKEKKDKKDKKPKKEKHKDKESKKEKKRKTDAGDDAEVAKKRKESDDDAEIIDVTDSKDAKPASSSSTVPAYLAFKPVQVMRKSEKDKPAAAVDEKSAGAPPENAAQGKEKQEKHKDKEHKKDKKSKDSKEQKDSKETKDAASKEQKKQEESNSSMKGIEALGNVDELRKQLAAQRNQLRLWIIKAKQDWEERQEQKGARGETNDQEYYVATAGELLGPKKEFKADSSIGRGVFSSVYKCQNILQKTEVAIKFIRANKMMQKAAEKEIETYRRLAKQAQKEDAEGAQYLMLLSPPDTFVHQGHMCMVFDLLKCDLRTALSKYGQGKGLPLQTVAQYARQIFLGLRCLRKIKLIHGDLKPDNVLMTLSKTEIKLCDFGSAMDVSEEVKTAYLQPRFYRAPEVILGNGYDTQIDLWSAGVTLYELVSGKILFHGKTNNAMIRQMLEVSGAMPKRMATTGEFSAKHFNTEGEYLHKDSESITGIRDVVPMKSYVKIKQPVSGVLEHVFKNPPPNSDTKTQEKLMPRVADLVTQCLCLDPKERFTPEQALAHPFFQKDK
eukprot:TRINITY_DN33554_c1_g1_i1.p1 TRINITY_DN33554_c1_g1~~TRINITY_DN33554_c1_g1_i1.p1  ORF type:complete len:570 (-),score=168.92 TRINITY_DN33554_c1_g1_i1:104-1813(-)